MDLGPVAASKNSEGLKEKNLLNILKDLNEDPGQGYLKQRGIRYLLLKKKKSSLQCSKSLGQLNAKTTLIPRSTLSFRNPPKHESPWQNVNK